MTTTTEREIREEAAGNGWEVVEIGPTTPAGDGLVPHGYVLVRRVQFPFPGRPFATVRWYEGPRGVAFEAGHYDLALEDAAEDFTGRCGGTAAR